MARAKSDPKFQTKRLFIRISAAEVRSQLIATKGYTDEQLPTQQTINRKLNMLGYWHRLERSLGRFSLVGTTVQAAESLPRHLVADEKHTTSA
jgi:hypothetical protein